MVISRGEENDHFQDSIAKFCQLLPMPFCQNVLKSFNILRHQKQLSLVKHEAQRLGA